MKQFLKTMLVVMLALCLIGVMVACNNGGDTEDPTDGATTVGDANESEGDPTESDSEEITTDGSAGGETDDGTTDAGEDTGTDTDTDTTPVDQPGMETEVDSGEWGTIKRPE